MENINVDEALRYMVFANYSRTYVNKDDESHFLVISYNTAYLIRVKDTIYCHIKTWSKGYNHLLEFWEEFECNSFDELKFRITTEQLLGGI